MFEICIKKYEEPNVGWAEYDCETCDGTFENAHCGGEYFYSLNDKIRYNEDNEEMLDKNLKI